METFMNSLRKCVGKMSWILTLSLLSASPVFAQYTNGYLFIAPGGSTSVGSTQRIFHLGGGAERLLDRGIGVGAEIGAVFPGQGPIDGTAGLFSINGYYHFRSEQTLSPFVTGGYSVIFQDFTESFGNYGGGIKYWYRDDKGLLLEGRDHVGRLRSGFIGHIWEVRVGFTFR
jgi:hypothetical protein